MALAAWKSADNGVGFDMSADREQTHRGLRNMRHGRAPSGRNSASRALPARERACVIRFPLYGAVRGD